MATVNFSVPEHVKREFNQAFSGRNKSAVIANLMREAVVQDRLDRESHAAIERILRRRRCAPIANDSAIQTLRQSGRP